MEWSEIIITIVTTLLGGTTISSIYLAVKYRKENKTIKASEATQSNVEAQKAQIELANLYRDKMLEMMDLLSVKQDKGNLNQEKMLSMLTSLDSRVDGLEVDMSHVKGYLNGELSAWVAQHQQDEA